MFKRIGEWWYAIKVARKYGMFWDPVCPLGQAFYSPIRKCVVVNPFAEHFIEQFMHEVGHGVYHKRRWGTETKTIEDYLLFFRGDGLVTYPDGKCVFVALEAEYQASRFALKSGKCNPKPLRTWLNTYTRCMFNGREYFENFENFDRSCYERYLDKVAKVSKIFYREPR